MHFGHMIYQPWCHVSLHGSLHVSQPKSEIEKSLPLRIDSGIHGLSRGKGSKGEDNPGRYVSTPLSIKKKGVGI